MAKSGKEEEKATPGESPVQTGGWDSSVKVRFRTFNGPAGVSETLRVAMTKEAYADLLGHAKETLDREICGVLLGDLCEDEYGLFLNIAASLRGTAAKTGGTHVTFTQETWNEIHKAREARHPKLQIVGWYHSHPGFGVEFSDMDLFIQKNFFGGTGQVAFVTDPLGGAEAMVANVDGRMVNIKRFWVDGRERKLYVPPSAEAASAAGEGGAAGATGGAMAPVSGEVNRSLEELQDRVRQLTETVEKQRTFFYNVWTFVGIIVAFCVIVLTVRSMLAAYYEKRQAPEEITSVRALVPLNGKPTWVTLGVRGWEVTPEQQMELDQMFFDRFVAGLTPEKVDALKAVVVAATQKAADEEAAATQKGKSAPGPAAPAASRPGAMAPSAR